MKGKRMGSYFILACHSNIEVEFYRLRADTEARKRRWFAGNLFSVDNKNVAFQSPTDVINLETYEEDDLEDWVYPQLTWHPIPLMKHSLVKALKESGVDNMQTYPTILTNPQGNPPAPSDLYLAVNIVGRVSAADMNSSSISSGNEDIMISVDFDSLVIDEKNVHGLRMFRLAENISAVLVHESVRNTIEKAGIDDLTWFAPEEWAG